MFFIEQQTQYKFKYHGYTWVFKIVKIEFVSEYNLDFSNEANERLACQYEGEDIEIGFNARFLTEILSNIDSKEIVMELSTPKLL